MDIYHDQKSFPTDNRSANGGTTDTLIECFLLNIDKKLIGMRSGPVPMARDENGRHTIPEIKVGISGLLYTRWVDDFSL